MFEVLPQKFTKLIDNRIIFNIVEDKEEIKILNYNIKFLDVQAKKDRQFGFKTILENGKKLVFLGDETFDEKLRDEVENADWLLHEAMCMDSEADIFKPYEKMHSTVKTASEIGASLNVKNLVLYHASDNDLENRKRLYTEEAKQYFNGNIYVPDDLDVIELQKRGENNGNYSRLCYIRDNKILMVKEAKKKCYGQWNFPAGHVDEHELIT